jgi:transcriptional regulator with XRE-family HTH domain
VTTTLAELIAQNETSPLRLIRVARGMTQRELERQAGLPATALSHFESRRRRPDPATAARIALSLDVDVDVEAIFPGGRG